MENHKPPLEETGLVLHEPAEVSLHGGEAPLGSYDSMPSGSPASLPNELRFKGTAVLIFLLVAGTVIPAIWWLTIPEYVSTAVVRVAPVIQRLVYRNEDNGM